METQSLIFLIYFHYGFVMRLPVPNLYEMRENFTFVNHIVRVVQLNVQSLLYSFGRTYRAGV